MPETEEQYRDRLAGYVKNEDPLQLQRQTLTELDRFLDGASTRQLALASGNR